jgi:hypothetical protein
MFKQMPHFLLDVLIQLLPMHLQQSKDYDPAGDYIRHWLPELKNVPTARIHEPW